MSNNQITTLYQPTFLSPSIYDSIGGCIDMAYDQKFSAVINGLQVDSYLLSIKNTNNDVLYTSGQDIKILNSDSNITYSGTWGTSQNQIIDDTDSNIQYYGYGWNLYQISNHGFYNNTVHQSTTANDYLQYTFVGTGINCYFTKGTTMGIFQVYIDGVDKGTIDNYGIGNYVFQNLSYSVTDLPLGSHTIKIVITGNKNASSTNSLIEFDYFQVLNSNSSKNSNTTGNYIQYNFTSNGIKVYMDKTPDSGIMQIYIDNISMGTVDLYSSTYDLNSIVYTNMNLSSSSHTIKIAITGNKNTQSKGAYCYFESLELINKTSLPTMLYDKDTFSVTIPANTVTYRGSLKWQLSLWNSSNNGEMVSSGEMIFINMSTPTLNYTIPNTINSKSYDFDANGDYSQAENIPIKKYNYSLYAINYEVYCGYFGQNVSLMGTNINCGSFVDTPNRYFINCGEF